MSKPKRKRLLTLLAAAGALAVVVLGGVYWKDLAAWVRFYRLFEYAGVNEQGLPEYRHRQTGIVMVRVPGGTIPEVVLLIEPGATDPPLVPDPNEVGALPPPLEFPTGELIKLSPFLISKHMVTQAEWERVMVTDPSRRKGDNSPLSGSFDSEEFCTRTGLSRPTHWQWVHACETVTTVSSGGGFADRRESTNEVGGDRYFITGGLQESEFHPAFYPLPPGL